MGASASIITITPTGQPTPCPFPWTTPAQPLDVNTTTAANCTATYAQVLDPFYTVLQGIMGAFGAVYVVAFSLRFVQLDRFARAQHRRLTETTQFEFQALGLAFSTFLLLESVDLFGFRGILPPEVYFISDEFLAAILYWITIGLTDFWLRLGGGIEKAKGLARLEKAFMRVGSVVCFVGFTAIGIIDYQRYFLYEGIKSLVMAAFLVFLLVRSLGAVLRLQKMLQDSSVVDRSSPSNNDKAVTVLRQKFGTIAVLMLVGSLALTVNFLISLGLFEEGTDLAANWPWRYAPEFDPVQVVLKLLWITAISTLYFTFRVPRDRGADRLSKSTSRSGTTAGIDPAARSEFRSETNASTSRIDHAVVAPASP